jgi:hypothetical protein
VDGHDVRCGPAPRARDPSRCCAEERWKAVTGSSLRSTLEVNVIAWTHGLEVSAGGRVVAGDRSARTTTIRICDYYLGGYFP